MRATDRLPGGDALAKLTMTVPEAAEALGISRDLAYDLIRRRRIPHVQYGRRVLVPREALKEHLEREAAASLLPPDVET